MENMKYFTFHRTDNNFNDIIKDATVKKYVAEKTTWYGYLRLGFNNKINDQIISYITLKYGDSILSSLSKDYRPIPNVDYTPVRK